MKKEKAVSVFRVSYQGSRDSHDVIDQSKAEFRRNTAMAEERTKG